TDTQSGAEGGYTHNAVEATPGLVAYWRLGEPAGAAGAADFSGNGITADNAGGAAFGVAGLLGSDPDTAASFDGVGKYLQFADNDLLDPQLGSMSWEAWFKTSSAAQEAIYRKSDSSNDHGVEIYLAGGRITCVVTSYDGTSYHSVTAQSPASPTYNDG